MLSFFSRGVLDEILDLIESVFGGFSYLLLFTESVPIHFEQVVYLLSQLLISRVLICQTPSYFKHYSLDTLPSLLTFEHRNK